MSTSTTAATNDKRKIDLTIIGGSDRMQRLFDGIRKGQECFQCQEKRTVIRTGGRSWGREIVFCAPCLADLLCVLCNKTHRRKR